MDSLTNNTVRIEHIGIVRQREVREKERENLPALNEVHSDPVFMKQLNFSQNNGQS